MSAAEYNTIYHCPLNELRAFANKEPELFLEYLVTIPHGFRAAIVRLITQQIH